MDHHHDRQHPGYAWRSSDSTSAPVDPYHQQQQPPYDHEYQPQQQHEQVQAHPNNHYIWASTPHSSLPVLVPPPPPPPPVYVPPPPSAYTSDGWSQQQQQQQQQHDSNHHWGPLPGHGHDYSHHAHQSYAQLPPFHSLPPPPPPLPPSANSYDQQQHQQHGLIVPPPPPPPMAFPPPPGPGSAAGNSSVGGGEGGASASRATLPTEAVQHKPSEQATKPSSSAANEKKDATGGGSKNNKNAGNNQKKPRKRDPDCTLVIKNLPDNIQEQDVLALLEPFATQTNSHVVEITVVGRGRGIAFVDFDSAEPVLTAVTHHNQIKPLQLMGNVLDVEQKTTEQRARRAAKGSQTSPIIDAAHPNSTSNNNNNNKSKKRKRQPSTEHSKKYTLAVHNLPDNVQYQDVMRVFKPFAIQTNAQVVAVRLPLRPTGGRQQPTSRFAFVDYDSVNPVRQALKQHQEEPIKLMGRVLDVEQKTQRSGKQKAKRKAKHHEGKRSSTPDDSFGQPPTAPPQPLLARLQSSSSSMSISSCDEDDDDGANVDTHHDTVAQDISNDMEMSSSTASFEEEVEELYPDSLLQSVAAKVGKKRKRKRKKPKRNGVSPTRSSGYDSMMDEDENEDKQAHLSKKDLLVAAKERLRVAQEKREALLQSSSSMNEEEEQRRQEELNHQTELLAQAKERLRAARLRVTQEKRQTLQGQQQQPSSIEVSESNEPEKDDKYFTKKKVMLLAAAKERLRVAQLKKQQGQLSSSTPFNNDNDDQNEESSNPKNELQQAKERLRAAQEMKNQALQQQQKQQHEGVQEEQQLEPQVVDDEEQQDSLLPGTMAVHKHRLEEAQAKKKKALKKKLHTMKLRHAAAQQQQSSRGDLFLESLSTLQGGQLESLLITGIGESGPPEMVRFPTVFVPPLLQMMDSNVDSSLEQGEDGDEADGEGGGDEGGVADEKHVGESEPANEKVPAAKLDQFADADSDDAMGVPAPTPTTIQADAPPVVTSMKASTTGQFDDPDEDSSAVVPPAGDRITETTEAASIPNSEQKEDNSLSPDVADAASDGMGDISGTVEQKATEIDSATDDGTGDNAVIEERKETGAMGETTRKPFLPTFADPNNYLKSIDVLKRKMELKRKAIELKEKLQRLEYQNQAGHNRFEWSRSEAEDDEGNDERGETATTDDNASLQKDEDEEAQFEALASMANLTKEELQQRRIQAQQRMDITQTKHLISKQSYLLSQQQKKVSNNADEIQQCKSLIARKKKELDEEKTLMLTLQTRRSAVERLLQEKAQMLMAKRRQMYSLQAPLRDSFTMVFNVTNNTDDDNHREDDLGRSTGAIGPHDDRSPTNADIEGSSIGATASSEGAGEAEEMEEKDNVEDEASTGDNSDEAGGAAVDPVV